MQAGRYLFLLAVVFFITSPSIANMKTAAFSVAVVGLSSLLPLSSSIGNIRALLATSSTASWITSPSSSQSSSSSSLSTSSSSSSRCSFFPLSTAASRIRIAKSRKNGVEKDMAQLLHRRRKLLHDLDRYEYSLKKLRQDRIDFLILRHEQQQQQQQRVKNDSSPSSLWWQKEQNTGMRMRTYTLLDDDTAAASMHHLEHTSTAALVDKTSAETAMRSAVKSILWRILSQTGTFVLAQRLSGSAKVASRLVSSSCLLKILVMYTCERLLVHHNHKIKGPSDYHNNSHGHSLRKALLWRLLAMGITLFWALFIARDMTLAYRLTGIDALYKTWFMYIYERVWAHIQWGKMSNHT